MIIDIIKEARDALLANPYFGDIAVVSEDLGDPINEIDKHLAKVGIGTILMTPKASVKFVDKPGPYFDDIQFIAAVYENVKMNRGAGGTGKKALDVCENILATLHWHKPQNVSEVLVPREPTIVLVPDRNFLAYNTLFGTQGGISSPIPTIAAPVVSVSAAGGVSTVTLTCATPLALVIYTTDGTYPSPARAISETAQYYTAPFNVATGTQIKVRAWLPGYIASPLVTQTV